MPLDGERDVYRGRSCIDAHGRFARARVPSLPRACANFCNGPDAEVQGLDGRRYHRACFQESYRGGKPG